MEKIWFPSVLIILIALLTVVLVISERENHRLERQNELLILKTDSLHMLQLKTRKDLLYSKNKIDSLNIPPTLKKKRP